MKKLNIKKGFLCATLVVLVSTSLTSCENKQQAGTLIGGATGALLGSQFGGGSGRLVGVGIGALAGAMIGNTIGASMDEQDKARMGRTAQNAFERSRTGQVSTWKNPDSGNHGTITPRKTYRSDEGEYCREYTQTIVVGGKKQEGYGTACRKPDGTWEVVS